MSLSIGIVGLPNVGKSTLFKALTKKEVLIANYPFATIDPNVGVVMVPDGRLDKLADFSHSAKKIPAIVEFVDIAGLVRGANKGEGLGNQFLANIREVDAVLYVLRAFDDPNIIHVEARVDPKADIEILTTELMLKDLETVEKHLEKVRKESRGGNKDAIKELPILERLIKSLGDGVMARSILEEPIRDLQLLTAKPGIILINNNVTGFNPVTLGDFLTIEINVREELDAAGLSKEEQEELGLVSRLPDLINIAYQTLGLMTFFTTGEDETRAWTTKQGASAPEAAGVIHTDFEEKFIRADVIPWDKLLIAGSWSEARAKGVMYTAGKDYIMKDGDVMEVKHGA
ncbi:MAG: redox-regulated ATPase YchF [Candidatus Spechtbacterales bacterium]